MSAKHLHIGHRNLGIGLMNDTPQRGHERGGIAGRANHQILGRVPWRHLGVLLVRQVHLRLAGSLQASDANVAHHPHHLAIVVAKVESPAHADPRAASSGARKIRLTTATIGVSRVSLSLTSRPAASGIPIAAR